MMQLPEEELGVQDAPPQAHVPGVTADGLITIDARCGRCAYSLMGLNIAQVCPECGVPARPSVMGARLEAASPKYVTTMQGGAGCVAVAAFLFMMLAIVQVLLSVLSMLGVGGWGVQLGAGAAGIVAMIAALAALIVFIIGWWLLTAPDPMRRAAHLEDSGRRATRAALIMLGSMPIAIGIAIGVSVIGFAIGALLGLLMIGGALLATITGLFMQYFCSLTYLVALSGRMAGDAIAEHARLMMWLGPLLVIGGTCPGGILQSAGAASPWFGTAGALFLVMPAVAWGLYWALLLRVRRGLKQVRELQRAQAM